MALTQLQVDYLNLKPSLREYFEGLADTSSSDGVDYFEKVPSELRSDSTLVETYLNGGTVEVPVWVDQRGAAGGYYDTVEYEVPDRDWSHDVSKANGGSDLASNGRFEEASVNRSRGADNTTFEEQAAADEASQFDAELLEKGTLVSDLDEAASLTTAAEVTSSVGELASTGLEFAADFLAPVVGGVTVGKVVSDQFYTTEGKVLAGGLSGVATALVLTTPVGQFGLGCYLSYKLYRRGKQFFETRAVVR